MGIVEKNEFDIVILNDDFDVACEEAKKLLKFYKFKNENWFVFW